MTEKPDGSKYARISAALRVEVEQLRPGESLPSERELARQWGVARMTVRRALAELASAGVVRTVHGAGTVRTPQPVPVRVQLGSFAATLRAQDLHPDTRLLDVLRDAEPPALVRDFLGAGADAILVRRLRLGDGIPLALERTWWCGELLGEQEARDFSGSLYDHLAERGRRPDAGEESVRADLPALDEARLLQAPSTRPVLRLTRRATLAGRPVEYAEAVIPADRCELWFPLTP